MDYKEFMDKVRNTNEKGGNVVYVPQKSDARTALEGAFLNTVLQKEDILYDVRFKTYHEPTQRIGESDSEFGKRMIDFEKDMAERQANYIVLGERGNITASEMYDILKDKELSFISEKMKETFIRPIEEDARKAPEDRTPLSQMIDSMNVTRKEMIGSKADHNFWNTTQIMEQAIDERVDNTLGKLNKKPTDLITSVEEDINVMRNKIPVEVMKLDNVIIIAVPEDVARIHFQNQTYDQTANGNMIIATLDEKEAKDIGIYEKIEPVIDDGGLQIYNAEGDNITMNIHQITDAWAKSQIHDAIENAKPFTRGNVSFSVVHLDQVGGFYEDIAKSAEGTDVVGYTFEKNGKYIFKPIQQEGFNLEIPEEWMEGKFPDMVEQCNQNGLSVTFKSKEAFAEGLETMLDEMGISRDTELEAAESEEEIRQEETETPVADEEEVEI